MAYPQKDIDLLYMLHLGIYCDLIAKIYKLLLL